MRYKNDDWSIRFDKRFKGKVIIIDGHHYIRAKHFNVFVRGLLKRQRTLTWKLNKWKLIAMTNLFK